MSKALGSLVYGGSGSAAAQDPVLEHRQAPKLEQCMLLNASICEPSVTASAKGEDLLVVVYNPLAWKRTQGVRIPLAAGTSSWTVQGALLRVQPSCWAGQLSDCLSRFMQAEKWTIADAEGHEVEAQLLPVSNSTRALQSALVQSASVPDASGAASHELAFLARLPPLGYSTFTLRQGAARQSPAAVSEAEVWHGGLHTRSGRVAAKDEALTADSGEVQLRFSPHTGLLCGVVDRYAVFFPCTAVCDRTRL